MGRIITRSTRISQQPGSYEINKSHPLARHVLALWGYMELREYVTGKLFSITNTGDMQPRYAGRNGVGIYRANNTSGVGYVDLPCVLPQDFTLFTFHHPVFSANPGGLLDDDDGANRRFQFRVSSNSASLIFFNTTNNAFTSTASYSDYSKPWMTIGVKDGTTISCGTNDRWSGSTNITGTPISGTSVVRAFNRKNATYNPYFGVQYFSGVLDIPLTQSEARLLFDFPYLLFKHVERRIYFDVGAGAPAGTALESAATATAASSGELTTQITLSGDALAQAVSTALLSSGITMTAAAVAQAAADGTLVTAIQLIGDAQAQSDAAGNLTTSTGGLEGNAQAQSDATAILTTQIRLSGDAVAQAEAAGSLGGIVDLAGAAVSVATASGELTVNIALTAQALATAIAQGSLTTQVMLAADAAAQAGASGDLTAQAAMSLTPADLAAIEAMIIARCPTAADIAAAVGARTVEGALSQDATLRILLAALSGRSTGLGTALEKYKSLDGSKDRIVVSFDASNNRVTVVLDGTA